MASRIHAALRAAREQGENLVLVLGHAEYYPRFGFTLASGYAIRPPFDVSDEYMMALAFDPTCPVPAGTIRYPTAFGVWPRNDPCGEEHDTAPCIQAHSDPGNTEC